MPDETAEEFGVFGPAQLNLNEGKPLLERSELLKNWSSVNSCCGILAVFLL